MLAVMRPVRRHVRRAASVVRSTAGGTRHTVRQRLAPSDWTDTSPARLHHVSPHAITHLTRERLPESLRGRRSAGDWDHDAIAIDELALSRVLRSRFVDGCSWEDAGLHEQAQAGGALVEVPGLGTRYSGLDRAGVERRGVELDRLQASLAADGWLPHHAFGAPFDRELAVAIGRDGRIVRNSGGLHRLILAQLLDLPSVPVRVLTEHVELLRPPAALRRGPA